MMLPGVRPSIRLASSPTLRTSFVRRLTATTLGSRSRMPRPWTWTRVFAVPRSMPMSRENRLDIRRMKLNMKEVLLLT